MIAILSRGLAGALLAMALTATAWADDPKAPAPRKELDARITASLHDVIDVGAKVYNSGDEEGCYRLYNAALSLTVPLLEHRPQLQKATEEKLAKAKSMSAPSERAFALREAIDSIRATVRKDLPPAGAGTAPPAGTGTPAVAKPLWERLGGEPVVTKVVHDFVAAAAKDPKVNFDRGGKYKVDATKLEKLLVEFVSSATGGPLKYSGRDMKTAHAGMGITAAEFKALVEHLGTALEKNNVPGKEIQEVMILVGGTKKDIVEK
jgi:hemoglobin